MSRGLTPKVRILLRCHGDSTFRSKNKALGCFVASGNSYLPINFFLFFYCYNIESIERIYRIFKNFWKKKFHGDTF